MPCPEEVPARPALPIYLQFYWRSYWDIHADRSMETGRISFLAIDRYAERVGIESSDEFERFHMLISAMDGEFQKRTSSKSDDGYSVDATDAEGVADILNRMDKKAVAMGL